MSQPSLRWPESSGAPVALPYRLLAAALMRASRLMARAADALAAPPARRSTVPADPRLEFHAEAGAPEGALYVDGEWVGRLDGVRRL